MGWDIADGQSIVTLWIYYFQYLSTNGGGDKHYRMLWYVIAKNVECNQLFPKQMTGEMGRKAIYENVFSIIHQACIHLSHARDVRSQKTFIDYLWYGVPENAFWCSLCSLSAINQTPKGQKVGTTKDNYFRNSQ